MLDKLDFNGIAVLVIGDIMLDKYYFGEVSRISPEAPVPIVRVNRTSLTLGGAANVANNVVHLGADVTLFGLVGNDQDAVILKNLSESAGISTRFIATQYPTITKSRIVGEKQQIVRMDFEEKVAIDEFLISKIKSELGRLISQTDIVIISDYAKGLIIPEVSQYIITAAKFYNKKAIVDPKGKDWDKYTGAFIITPNIKEFAEVTNKKIENNNEDIEKYSLQIISKYNLEYLLVTRSDKGMSLISAQKNLHIGTEAKEIFDVSGAGDTVISTLGVAVASNMEIQDAIIIANKAAGIVVGKFGTAPITLDELKKAFKSIQRQDKIIKLADLVEKIKILHSNNKSVNFIFGLFDIINKETICELKSIKDESDVLIVGLFSDDYINKEFVTYNLLNNENDRAFTLSCLEFVDSIVLLGYSLPNIDLLNIRYNKENLNKYSAISN